MSQHGEKRWRKKRLNVVLRLHISRALNFLLFLLYILTFLYGARKLQVTFFCRLISIRVIIAHSLSLLTSTEAENSSFFSAFLSLHLLAEEYWTARPETSTPTERAVTRVGSGSHEIKFKSSISASLGSCGRFFGVKGILPWKSMEIQWWWRFFAIEVSFWELRDAAAAHLRPFQSQISTLFCGVWNFYLFFVQKSLHIRASDMDMRARAKLWNFFITSSRFLGEKASSLRFSAAESATTLRWMGDDVISSPTRTKKTFLRFSLFARV